MFRWSLSLLAVVLVALAAAGTAQSAPFESYSVSLTVQPSGRSHIPIHEPQTVEYEVRVYCPSTLSVPPLEPVQVDLSAVAAAPGVLFRIIEPSHSVSFRPTDCQQEVVHAIQGAVEFTFTPASHAFEQVPFRLHANTHASGHGEQAEFAWSERPGQILHSEVRLAETILRVDAGETGAFPLALMNGGNGVVAYLASSDTQDAPGMEIVLPAGMRLDAGAEATYSLMVLAPSTPGSYPVAFTIRPVSYLDPDLVESPVRLQALLIVDDSGLDPVEELPAPNMVLPGLVVLALAAVLRRVSR